MDIGASTAQMICMKADDEGMERQCKALEDRSSFKLLSSGQCCYIH